MGSTQFKTFEDNKHSVDDKIGLLERYLLSQSKKEFFEGMVASSEIYKYMRYSDYLNNPQDYDKAALEQELVQYLLEIDNCLKDEINFKQLALKAAEEQDQAKRKKLLMEMNRLYFNIEFNFKPPSSLAVARSQVSGEQASTGAGGNSKQVLASSLTQWQLDQLDPVQVVQAITDFDPQAEYETGKPLDNFRQLVGRMRCALLKAVDLQQVFKKGLAYVEIVLNKLASETESFCLAKNVEVTLLAVYKACADLKHGSGDVRKIDVSPFYGLLTAEQIHGLAKSELGKEPSFIEMYLKSLEVTSKPLDLSALPDSPCKKALQVLNLQWSVMDSLSFDDLKKWLDSRVDVSGFPSLDQKYRESLNRQSVVNDYVDQFKNWMPRKDGWLCHEEVFDRVAQKDFVKEYRAGSPQTAIFAKYEQYFEAASFKKKFAKAVVQIGGKVENLTSIFSEYEMAEQRYEKILRLKDGGKLEFSRPEEVRFTVEIKGISKLQLSVYEVDMETFFENSSGSTNPFSVDTRGFKPQFVWEKKYDDSQLVLIEEEVSLLEAIKSQGTFIVEALGGGLFFKTCFTIGQIAVVQDTQTAFCSFTVVDKADGKVLPGCSLKISREWFAADAETGLIRVPTEKLYRGPAGIPTIAAIVKTPQGLVHRQLLDAVRKQPTMTSWTLFNPSSLTPLAPMKLLLFPDIKPFFPAAAEFAVRLTYTDLHGARVERSVTPVASGAFERALEVEDVVPEQTASIGVQLTATWEDGASTAKCSDSLTLGPSSGRHAFKSLVMAAAAADCYRVQLLGKNGEQYAGAELKVLLTTAFFERPLAFDMVTNDEGAVTLPRLAGLEEIRVELADDSQVANSWRVRADQCVQLLQPTLDVSVADCLQLPIDPLCRDLPPSLSVFELFRLSEKSRGKGQPLTDQPLFAKCVTAKVKKIGLDKNWLKSLLGSKETKTACLELAGLPVGSYQAVYGFSRKVVRLVVHEAKKPTPGYLMTEESLKPVSLSPVIMDEPLVASKDGVATVEFRIKVASSQPPVLTVMGANYFAPVQRLKLPACGSAEASFESQRGSYKSGKLAGDLAYALERKNAEPLVGSTLDRPSFLLKRELVRETKESEPRNAEAEEDFSREHSKVCAKHREKADKDCNTGSQDGKTCYQPWVKHKGKTLQVRMHDQDGTWVAKVALDGDWLRYSQVFGTIVTQEGLCVGTSVVCPSGLLPVAKADVSLATKLSDNTVAFEQREVKVATDCQFSGGVTSRMVGTKADLFQVLGLLSGSADILAQWAFVCQWPSLPVKKQLEYYAVFASNELHLFLYFNDKEFTEMVVRPHLRNKNKKNLVDLFVLGDREAMRAYFTPFGLSSLNFLEIALLITTFKDAEPQECKNYVQKLAQEVAQRVADPDAASAGSRRRIRQLNSQQYRDKFDLVLNSQAEKLSALQSKAPASVRNAAPSVATEYVPQMEDNVSEFAAMGVTNEVVERGWLLYSNSVIDPSAFWLEYLEREVKGQRASGFLSQHWMQVSNNPAECLAMVALLDLPFDNEVRFKADSAELSHPGFVLEKKFVSRQQEEAVSATRSGSLMISQKFFSAAGSEEVETLHPSTAYKMRVIVMNCNDKPLQGTLIAQIPERAVPLHKTNYADYSNIRVEAFDRLEKTYDFYYSGVAAFQCHPASIVCDGVIVAQATLKPGTRVELPQHQDFKAVLEEFGKQSTDEVSSIDLSQVYHKLVDEEFYRNMISILKKRFEFDPTVWSFSLYHGDLANLRDYMQYRFQGRPIKLNQFDIFYFRNAIFDVDYFNFREYVPLTNPRVHDISQYQHNILNRDFLNTYYVFLKYFQDKGRFDPTDLVSLCVYTLMQDRVADAVRVFKRIPPGAFPEGSPMKLQFDYVQCYLAMLAGDTALAKQVARDYIVYPVFPWRDKFRDVLAQVCEHEGKAGPAGEAVKAEQTAESAVFLKAAEVNGQIRVTAKGVAEVLVEFYEIDLEEIFATNPSSLLTNSQISTSLKCNYSKTYALCQPARPEDLAETTIEPPSEFAALNYIARISSPEASTSVRVAKKSLRMTPVEAYGQMKVCALDGKPLARCYVKCLSKNHGAAAFGPYKDGYTDLRGNFDYVSLNSGSLAKVAQFLLLTVSIDHGCAVLQTVPPKRAILNRGLQGMSLLR